MSKHWCRPEPVVLAMFSCIGYYHYCYPKRKVLVPALGPSCVGRAVRAQSPFCKCMQHPELVVLAMFPCIRLLGTVTTFIQHRLPGAQHGHRSANACNMALSWAGLAAWPGRETLLTLSTCLLISLLHTLTKGLYCYETLTLSPCLLMCLLQALTNGLHCQEIQRQRNGSAELGAEFGQRWRKIDSDNFFTLCLSSQFCSKTSACMLLGCSSWFTLYMKKRLLCLHFF